LTLQKQKSAQQEDAKQPRQTHNIIKEKDISVVQPKPPYLPKQVPGESKFTLVLDLDETLIHYFEMPLEGQTEGGHFLIRPGARKFLKDMSKCYEVVIFTAAMQDYADWVLDALDTDRLISYRLYRQHTHRTNHVFIKDLSFLGRDLSQCVIVDNVAANFQN